MCSACFTQPSHPAASVPFNSTISMCILQHSQTVSAVFLLHSSFFLFFLSFGVFFTTYTFRFSFFSVDQLVHNKHIGLECYLKDKKAHHAWCALHATHVSVLQMQWCNFPCVGASTKYFIIFYFTFISWSMFPSIMRNGSFIWINKLFHKPLTFIRHLMLMFPFWGFSHIWC